MKEQGDFRMDNLRNIPAIDEILEDGRIKSLTSQYNRQFIVTIVRQADRKSVM